MQKAYSSAQSFIKATHKNVTLLGMSGVGKTHLSRKLVESGFWFHYSGDYRIGTRYLAEPILDNIKYRLMSLEPLSNLLRSDAIYLSTNISIDNLTVVIDFLGKPGNPEKGGLSLTELKRRHSLHHAAELAAMRDVPDFIHKAQYIYQYQNFVNDAGGSLCDLRDPETLELLAKHTAIIYMESDQDTDMLLKERAHADPKPLYYREAYIDQFMHDYLADCALQWVACVDPDSFTRWVFPRLLRLRTPTYAAIARQYGYTVSAKAVSQTRDEQDFIELVASAIDKKSSYANC